MFRTSAQVGFLHLVVVLLALAGLPGHADARSFGLSPPGDYYTVFPHDPVMLTLTSYCSSRDEDFVGFRAWDLNPEWTDHWMSFDRFSYVPDFTYIHPTPAPNTQLPLTTYLRVDQPQPYPQTYHFIVTGKFLEPGEISLGIRCTFAVNPAVPVIPQTLWTFHNTSTQDITDGVVYTNNGGSRFYQGINIPAGASFSFRGQLGLGWRWVFCGSMGDRPVVAFDSAYVSPEGQNWYQGAFPSSLALGQSLYGGPIPRPEGYVWNIGAPTDASIGFGLYLPDGQRVGNGEASAAALVTSFDQDALAIPEGTVTRVKTSTSGSPSVSRVRSIDIPKVGEHWAGTLDLTNNALIVQATADSREQLLLQLTDQIRSARNYSAGTWTGYGMTSSAAAADARQMTTLGVAVNDRQDGSGAIYTLFQAYSVDENSIIIRYTWNGDANLDGVVNADYYFLIDTAFITQQKGWYNGDFNYDGVINADDYFLIDSAFLGQTGPLSAAVRAPAVPEPATLSLLAFASLTLIPRRRRT